MPSEDGQSQTDSDMIISSESDTSLVDSEDDTNEKVAHKVNDLVGVYAGHNMSSKCTDSIRVGSLCIDSMISMKEAAQIANPLIEEMITHGVGILCLSETAVGSETGTYHMLKSALQGRGFDSHICSRKEHNGWSIFNVVLEIVKYRMRTNKWKYLSNTS